MFDKNVYKMTVVCCNYAVASYPPGNRRRAFHWRKYRRSAGDSCIANEPPENAQWNAPLDERLFASRTAEQFWCHKVKGRGRWCGKKWRAEYRVSQWGYIELFVTLDIRNLISTALTWQATCAAAASSVGLLRQPCAAFSHHRPRITAVRRPTPSNYNCTSIDNKLPCNYTTNLATGSASRRSLVYPHSPGVAAQYYFATFSSRVSTLTRDIDIAILSVGPSVCPSRCGIL